MKFRQRRPYLKSGMQLRSNKNDCLRASIVGSRTEILRFLDLLSPLRVFNLIVFVNKIEFQLDVRCHVTWE